jgi:putative membrane protein
MAVNGVWHGWWMFPLLWMGLILVLVLLFGFVGRRFWWRRYPGPADKPGSGQRVLAERYARGEIDEDEYRRRLAFLRKENAKG